MPLLPQEGSRKKPKFSKPHVSGTQEKLLYCFKQFNISSFSLKDNQCIALSTSSYTGAFQTCTKIICKNLSSDSGTGSKSLHF